MEEAGLDFLLDAVDRLPLREEFADCLEHPDPVPMALFPRSEASRAVPADSNAGSGCRQQDGSDGPDKGECAGVQMLLRLGRRSQLTPRTWLDKKARRRGQTHSKSLYELVSRSMVADPKLWLRSAPADQTPCPSRMSALEHDSQLRRGADKEGSTICTCSGEAYDFYNLYTWEIGFGIRYDKSRLNAERTKYMQEIVCGCSGLGQCIPQVLLVTVQLRLYCLSLMTTQPSTERKSTVHVHMKGQPIQQQNSSCCSA